MISALFALTLAQRPEIGSSPEALEAWAKHTEARAKAARAPNGYALYLRAAARVAHQSDPMRAGELVRLEQALATTGRFPSAEALKFYRAYLRGNQEALALVRKGNALPVRYPARTLTFASLQPEAAPFKEIARLFVYRARVRFADGNTKGGAEALLDGLSFVRKSASGNLLSALVSRTGERRLLAAVAAYADRLSSKDLDRLDVWAKQALAGGSVFTPTVATELRMYRGSFDDFITYPEKWMDDGKDNLVQAKRVREGFAKLTKTQRDTHYNFILARLERPTAALLKRLKEPESRWTEPLEIAQSDNFPAPKFVPPDGVTAGVFQYLRLFRMLSPTEEPEVYASDLAEVAARQRVQQRLLRLHLAICRYRQLHGRLPKDLSALAVNDLPEADPVTSTPYSYAIKGPRSYRLSNESKELGSITLADTGVLRSDR